VVPPTATPAQPTAATPALPKPKDDVALDPTQRKAYLAALDAGRKAHRAKDYPAAIRGFDAALALQPDDPRALAERGWARFQAGQLPEAEADTLSAIARTTDRKLLGSAWYNLGRVREAQGRKDDAAKAYGVSLGFRPNDTVSARLASLGVTARDAYTAAPMAGPYATLDAWCDARKAALQADVGSELKVLCDPTGTRLGEYEGPRATSGGPFSEVKVLAVGIPIFGDALDGGGEMHLSLAVRTASGWYTRDGLLYVYNPGAFGIFQSATAESLVVQQDRVVFAYGHDGHDSDMGVNEIQSDATRWLLVCGLGTTGPACIDPILTSERSERARLLEDEPEEPGIEHTFFSNAWEGSARLTPDGAVEISGPPHPQHGAQVGRHALVFP
jgi:hypothetical protein